MRNDIRHYRIRKGLTQAQVADRLGVTQQAVANWESGATLPTAEKALKLAQMFDVPFDKIIKI